MSAKSYIIHHVKVPKDKKFVTINKAGIIKARKGGRGARGVEIGRIKRKPGMRYWVKNGAVHEAPAVYFQGKKRFGSPPPSSRMK